MGVYKIAVIRGDGIGVDVVEEGLKVFNEIAIKRGITMDFKEFPSSFFLNCNYHRYASS